MTYLASKACACVALRIMAYEGTELTEEYLDILMSILYDLYTSDEIQKIYKQNIVLDSYEAIVGEMTKINE